MRAERLKVRVKLAGQPTEWAGAVVVRVAVFVDEQHVPLAAEFDEHDRAAVHAVAVLVGGAAEFKSLARARAAALARAVAQAGKHLPVNLAGARASPPETTAPAPVVGTARLIGGSGGTYRFGRLAVLAPWRGRAIGSRILRLLEEVALARGARRLLLHAQTQVESFYAKHGYAVDTPRAEFLEDGIPHVRMSKALSLEL
ncbi:MAG: GNAT family N-acetyltransferase [Chloroflexota bacterium]